MSPAGLLSKVRLGVDNPVVHFRNVAGKISYVTSLLMQIGSLGIVAAAVIVTADQVARLLIGDTDWFATIGLRRSIRFGPPPRYSLSCWLLPLSWFAEY